MIYKAEFDEHDNYNDCPVACSKCQENLFTVSAMSWICANCETENEPDMERTRRYWAQRELKKKLRVKRKKKKFEDTDLDGLGF